MKNNTYKMVQAAMFMALGLVLPFVTLQIPAIGQMLSPMHIPIMLCGIFCGPFYGLIIGFITPVLRSVLFGMPAMIPGAASMSFELATYGLVIGLIYKILPKKVISTYIALIISGLCGRVVWGIARLAIAGIIGNEFTYAMFIAGAFTNAIPGIILQLVVIPPLVYVAKRNIKSE